jgi:hypothetical protein
VTIMTGCSSDDWILLVLRLQILFITLNYSAIAESHNLQFAAGHALGFSVFTSRLLATDLNKETTAHTLLISLHYSTYKVFKSHAKSSQADFFFDCELPAAISYRQLPTDETLEQSPRPPT